MKNEDTSRMGRNPFEKTQAKTQPEHSHEDVQSGAQDSEKPWTKVILQDLPAAILMVGIRKALNRAEWIARRTGHATGFERFRSSVGA